MCGIFGIVSPHLSIEESVLHNACTKLAHRGPDGMGFYSNPPVFFGHRRLSIIDLDGGTQPLSTSCGRYVITFNGEIYNYKDLRKELVTFGYHFRTSSDTEVLLLAYQHWGKQCLDHLEGMFAFAIADFEKRVVFCARDPFGIKPFVYRIGEHGVAFASEIPSLKDLPEWKNLTIDSEAVALFFRYQFIPAPHTIYKEIRKLRAGHAMEISFDNSVPLIWQYFSPILQPDPRFTLEEAEYEVEQAIKEAVLAATVSDVPIGVFLSGGIDSTLIALNLAQFYDDKIPAFTINFHEKSYSELDYAQEAAKKLNLNLTVDTVGADIIQSAPKILANFGEPFGDSSILPTWEVSRLAKKHVTVVLSGDGGDELFGGYGSYSAWVQNNSNSYLLSSVLHNFLSLHLRAVKRDLCKVFKRKDFISFWHEHIQYYSPESLCGLLLNPYHSYSNLFAESFQDRKKTSNYGLEFAQYNDLLSYLPDCILPKVDIASMGHSLETRPPLLSKKVFEIASRLPSSSKMNSRMEGKLILKNILRKNGFSPSFVDRPKQGFAIPRVFWFLEDGKARKSLEEIIHDSSLLKEFLNIDYVLGLLNKHSLNSDMSGSLWLVYVFAVWLYSNIEDTSR
jgi:asparagine synthase (glutamine-hydrolysing)